MGLLLQQFVHAKVYVIEETVLPARAGMSQMVVATTVSPIFEPSYLRIY